MSFALVTIGAFLLGVALFWLLRQGGDSGAALENELFRLCRGDREMMERLIALEIDRGSDKRRIAAVRAAIRSLKRDS